MENSTKWILGIGSAVVLIGGGTALYYFVLKPKIDAKKIAAQAKQDLINSGVPEKLAEEQSQQIKKDIEDAIANPQTVPAAPTIDSIVKTENKIEVDKKNFENLKSNLGDKAAWKSAVSVGLVAYNGKFVVVFYPGGSFLIYKAGDAKKTTLLAGGYKNGGLTLNLQGKEFVGFGGNGVGVLGAMDRLIKSQIK